MILIKRISWSLLDNIIYEIVIEGFGWIWIVNGYFFYKLYV